MAGPPPPTPPLAILELALACPPEEAVARLRAGGVGVVMLPGDGGGHFPPEGAGASAPGLGTEAAGSGGRAEARTALVVGWDGDGGGGGGSEGGGGGGSDGGAALFWARLGGAVAAGRPVVGVVGGPCPLCWADGGGGGGGGGRGTGSWAPPSAPPPPPPPPPPHLWPALAAAGGRTMVAACMCGVEAAVARSHQRRRADGGAAPGACHPADVLLVAVAAKPARERGWLGAGLTPRVPLAATTAATPPRPLESGWWRRRPAAAAAAAAPPPPRVVFERAALGGPGGVGFRAPAAAVAALFPDGAAAPGWPRPPALDGLLHKVTDAVDGQGAAVAGEEGAAVAGEEGAAVGERVPPAPPFLPPGPAAALADVAARDGAALVVPFDAAAVAADRWATAAAAGEALGQQARRAGWWSWWWRPGRGRPGPATLRAAPSLAVPAGTAIDAAWLASARDQLWPGAGGGGDDDDDASAAVALVAKPREGAGAPGAHALALALLPGGVDAPGSAAAAAAAVAAAAGPGGGDVLVQPYIDHGGTVHKVYVAAAGGGRGGGGGGGGGCVSTCVVSSPSGPDLGGGRGGGGGRRPPACITLDSRRPGPAWAALRRAAGAGEGRGAGPPRPPPPRALLEAGAAALAAATGLVLFGFDAIVDAATGDVFVVDINYLPSLTGLTAAAVCAAVAGVVERERGGSRSHR